ncbi:D-inositol 3-phosphate glycosyltransferase [Prochlorococcus marinus str. MIT 1313]|uniref:glycosyltransferase n=1 Tax=Prochlorococcus TaxID=1218 RepID=UPI0007B3409D|nr:glycosyltransferase [Prochlorococcus marinus]KZR72334.1 D-inositol 3-phosphate glycosyltransferase [Prochlorococcus marinus str. MIT 1313]KZR74073.1 D-inositol 3-phosphate glycosyltransferase [Prochlorococcus marinus str. MIT 1318]
MRLLLVHQNFPGQFRDLSPALCDKEHELKAIGCSQRPCDSRIEVLRYEHGDHQLNGAHNQTTEVDDWIRRSEKVAELAMSLKERGWAPDVILAHPGWGEAMLLREVFPASPLIIWPELWLKANHLGLDAEQQLSVQQMHYLRTKNWLVDGAMADATIAVLPTHYQANSFPARWRNKIRVIHEGVPEAMLKIPRLQQLALGNGITLGPEVPVVTFISRNLEPMRGFHTFMRALPALLRHHPEVQIVVVGGDEVSYSSAPDNNQSWRQVMLSELSGQFDLKRVHLFGRIPHEQLVKLYRRSNLHIYLSNAFVLSWSLLEVMACGTPVLAQANPMMEELIKPGVNGALWRGHHPESLAMAIVELLNQQEQLNQWGEAGKLHLQPTYLQSHCINQLETLLQEQAARF